MEVGKVGQLAYFAHLRKTICELPEARQRGVRKRETHEVVLTRHKGQKDYHFAKLRKRYYE